MEQFDQIYVDYNTRRENKARLKKALDNYGYV